jgi:hypothetical protein
VEDARVLSDGGRGKSRRASGKAKGRAKEAERERGRRKGRGGLLGDTLPKL